MAMPNVPNTSRPALAVNPPVRDARRDAHRLRPVPDARSGTLRRATARRRSRSTSPSPAPVPCAPRRVRTPHAPSRLVRGAHRRERDWDPGDGYGGRDHLGSPYHVSLEAIDGARLASATTRCRPAPRVNVQSSSSRTPIGGNDTSISALRARPQRLRSSTSDRDGLPRPSPDLTPVRRMLVHGDRVSSTDRLVVHQPLLRRPDNGDTPTRYRRRTVRSTQSWRWRHRHLHLHEHPGRARSRSSRTPCPTAPRTSSTRRGTGLRASASMTTASTPHRRRHPQHHAPSQPRRQRQLGTKTPRRCRSPARPDQPRLPGRHRHGTGSDVIRPPAW